MPARNYIRKKVIKKRVNMKSFVLIVLLSVASFILLYVKRSTRYWDGVTKISLVIEEEGGNYQISTFDPEQEEIITRPLPLEIRSKNLSERLALVLAASKVRPPLAPL